MSFLPSQSSLGGGSSSVAAERAFSLMRSIDDPGRANMGADAFIAEFMFCANAKRCKRIMNEKLDHCTSLKGAMKAASTSGASEK